MFALYLLLVGKVSTPELTAGAIIAAIATAGISAIRLKRNHAFSIRPTWIKNVRFVPARIVADCAIVLAAICRRPIRQRGTGRFRLLPFAHGDERPAVRTRRAWITLAASITPNSFVVEAAADRDEILVHELCPRAKQPENKYWPI